MYGAHCNHAYERCADVPGLSSPFPRAECPAKIGNHSLLTVELVLDTPMTPSWPTYYLVPIASAVSELLTVDDICDVSLKSAVAESEDSTRIVLGVRRLTLEESEVDVNKLHASVSDESLSTLFSRRGIAPRTVLVAAVPFGTILL